MSIRESTRRPQLVSPSCAFGAYPFLLSFLIACVHAGTPPVVGMAALYAGSGSDGWVVTGEGAAAGPATSVLAPADMTFNYLNDDMYFASDGGGCNVRKIAYYQGTVTTAIGSPTGGSCNKLDHWDPMQALMQDPWGILFRAISTKSVNV